MSASEDKNATDDAEKTALCRDCLTLFSPAAARCPDCASPRLVHHPEIARLAVAHVDCDAFYASVEKRDDPKLADRPVIVGGGQRGVVSAACYIARTYGIHSAMPMFKAKAACPDAVVIRPDMEKYAAVSREIRKLMRELTPLVEPLSIDEAFLDLSGTERLHRLCPAQSLARFAKRIEREIGVTVSIGLSYNKFLAKIASDMDKPRGFAVIGQAEAKTFLAAQPVTVIWGVGAAFHRRLTRDNIHRIGDLQRLDRKTLSERYGAMGLRLYHLARGEDDRAVQPRRGAKSVSSETTFASDIAEPAELERRLWLVCERTSARAKAAGLSGKSVTLKLKTANFRQVTRSRTLAEPTLLAEILYRTARPLLAGEFAGGPYRLIGVGLSNLSDAAETAAPTLLGDQTDRISKTEAAMDKVRQRFGRDALVKGRAWKP
jgi:DNA polymerase-4